MEILFWNYFIPQYINVPGESILYYSYPRIKNSLTVNGRLGQALIKTGGSSNFICKNYVKISGLLYKTLIKPSVSIEELTVTVDFVGLVTVNVWMNECEYLLIKVYVPEHFSSKITMVLGILSRHKNLTVQYKARKLLLLTFGLSTTNIEPPFLSRTCKLILSLSQNN